MRSALGIPCVDIWEAHTRCKERLIEHVNQKCAAQMEPGVLTLGFARRATTYKRGDLLFSDLERLKKDILKERKNPGDLCRQSPSG